MKQDRGFIYVVQMEGHPLYKIGRSSNVPRRMSEIGIQLPFPYQLCFAHRVPNSHFTESDLHDDFSWARLNGEWFRLTLSALTIIEAKLLVIQVQDLVDRIVSAMDPVEMTSTEELARYGRLFLSLSKRLDRRLATRHESCVRCQAEVEAADALSAEIIG